jgi:hypothetical protein
VLSHPDGKPDDIISMYYSPHAHAMRPLQAGDINKLVKASVVVLGLDKKGFPPTVVSSHSL